MLNNLFPTVYFDGKRKFFWTLTAAKKEAELLFDKGDIKSYQIITPKETVGAFKSYLEADIDEIKVWNKALSQDEVDEIYNIKT